MDWNDYRFQRSVFGAVAATILTPIVWGFAGWQGGLVLLGLTALMWGVIALWARKNSKKQREEETRRREIEEKEAEVRRRNEEREENKRKALENRIKELEEELENREK